MEIRLHGRGGQGGVTCAKLLAALYARLGRSVQTFGDYAGERAGAPVRAYLRVSDTPITNRNKVYRPDHLLVLDASLLGAEATAGLAPGGTLLINTPEAPEALGERFGAWRVATVDATAIARRHRIGTRSVVIVNTTLAGAAARAFDLPLPDLEEVFRALGLWSNVEAAREAFAAVRLGAAPTTRRTPETDRRGAPGPAAAAPARQVLPLVMHVEGGPTGLETGSWRTQAPRYVQNLAPCNAWCPAGNDVVGFVQALATQGEEAAALVLGRTTPFAAVCGRVCPAPCMEGCNRREFDGSVNIRGLERWIADHAPVAPPEPAVAERPRRIAVVGAGPAGLSAAYALAGLGHSVTLFEGERRLGGLLRTGIPAYRLPREALDAEIEGILSLGVDVRSGEFLGRAALAELACDFEATILATGLARPTETELPGRGLVGVEQGLTFLRRHNLGLPGALRCSGTVLVLGGGNTAIDCARTARRAGAERVIVAYRRTRAEMPAIAEEIVAAEHEQVEFRFLCAPVAFRGEGSVNDVELAEVELGEPDASGRRRPVPTDRRVRIPCDRVLLALGQTPDLSVLPAGWELRAGRVYRDGAPLAVFAAGDLSTGDGTVTHAIGSGRRAAGLVLRALGLEIDVFERPDRQTAVPVTDLRLDHFERSAPAPDRETPYSGRLGDATEVNRGLAAPLEAHRCFSCGHCTRCDTCLVYCPEGIIRRSRGGYEVDYAFCKGCGICATECPRKALEMHTG